MKLKTCSKCGEEKTLDCFYKHKGMKDGLRKECKECIKIKRCNYYAANKKRRAEKDREYYLANKERKDATGRKWREANPKKNAYIQQKAKAKQRGIKFLLTFEEWRDWWGDDWDQRGCTKGGLVMARHGDTGPYALDNIYKTTCEENSRDRERFKAKEMHQV